MPKTKKYHRGNLRETLLQRAFTLAEKKGIADLSLRSIARAAGVTHAAPYAHFKSKEEIVVAMKEIVFHELRTALIEGANEKKSPEDKLLGLAQAYLRYLLSHPTKFQIIFRYPLKDVDPNRNDVKAGVEAFQLLLGSMGAYLATGKKKRSDTRVREISVTAWALLHGLVSLWIDGPLGYITATNHSDSSSFERTALQTLKHFLRDSL